MKYATIVCCAAATLTLAAAWPGSANAQKGVAPSAVTVGGKPMLSDHAIMENLAQSAEHSVFVGLLRTAGMAETLQGRGPFTVFAPTDAAFAALPSGMLEMLQQPENRPQLVALLSTQIVPGNYSAARLHYLMRTGKGQTELETVDGDKLSVTTNGPLNIMVSDPKGDTSAITLYDAKAANGVFFVTDRVLLPG